MFCSAAGPSWTSATRDLMAPFPPPHIRDCSRFVSQLSSNLQASASTLAGICTTPVAVFFHLLPDAFTDHTVRDLKDSLYDSEEITVSRPMLFRNFSVPFVDEAVQHVGSQGNVV